MLPLEIGEDLTIDRLVSEIMTAGTSIKRVVWTSPVDDVVVDDDELAVLNSLTLTYTVVEL